MFFPDTIQPFFCHRGLVKDLKLDDNKNVKSKNKGGKNKGNGDASRRGKGSKSKSKGSSGSKVDKPKERKSKGAPSKKKKVPRTPATDESAPAADQPSPAKKSRKSKAKAWVQDGDLNHARCWVISWNLLIHMSERFIGKYSLLYWISHIIWIQFDVFCSEWKSNVICGSTIFDALTILGLPSPCAEHMDQFLLGLCVIDPCAVDYHSWVKLKTQAMKCHNPASLKWSMKRTFAIGSPCKHTAKCTYVLKPYIDIYRKPQGSSPTNPACQVPRIRHGSWHSSTDEECLGCKLFQPIFFLQGCNHRLNMSLLALISALII